MPIAELVLAPLLQVIFEKLANPLVQKFAEAWDFEDRLKKLQEVLPMVQAVLEDAEEQQITNRTVRIWLSEIKQAAYEAEDLLAEFLYYSTGTSTPYAISQTRTRNILDALKKAAVQGLTLQLKERTVVVTQSDRRETSSFVMGSDVYGREEDERKIIELLLSSSSSGNLLIGANASVISIVGIPGVGKTTLAQLAYNNEEVKRHFDLRSWVFVSREFRAKNIIKAVIESARGKHCELSQLDMLHSKLWEILCKRRFLVVLDDVWDVDQDEREKLGPLFGGGVGGSKILVTTRNQKVPLLMAFPSVTYQLKSLSEAASWDLFRRQTFHPGEEDRYQNLLAIGIQIVRKCFGVPLAIKTIGSTMRFKREEREWLCVQRSDLWNTNAYRARILPALELSYLQLPSNLKHCFAFCSTFPRNYDIQKEKLIHMWMAHDLILSDGGSRRLEDIGDDYFNELLRMSFFEEVKECHLGFTAVYKVNDLFYSLAQSLTRDESMVLEDGIQFKNFAQVRHASRISNHRSSIVPEDLYQATRLRTLLLFSDALYEVPSEIFSSFFRLRVLNLSGCRRELPESMCKVPLLRYLDLSNSHFQKLPASISSISSLLSLNLFGCYNLKLLPSISSGLRHLNISGCEALIEVPIKNSVHLQTLPIYIVPKSRKFQNREILYPRRKLIFGSSISDLKDLDLHGELKIKRLERVCYAEDAKEANLQNKENLESIGLCWGPNGADLVMNPSLEASIYRLQERKQNVPGTSQEPEMEAGLGDQELAGEVLASLQPPKNLKKLFILGYPGIRFPLWKLPKLTMVALAKCSGCFHLPTLGHLPYLRILRMEEMNNVISIAQEFYGRDVDVFFPSLQELSIQNFPALQEWSRPDGRETFLKLQKLVVRNCPNLNSVPLLPSVQQLELQGCNQRILKCMEELTSLSKLSIEGFNDLLSLPGKLLSNNYHLNHLKIISCPKLQSLASDLRGISSLKSLTIRWCEELSSLPKGLEYLTALETLEIGDCHSLKNFPENGIGELQSLRILSIENCSDLAFIPIGSHSLTVLEHLTFMYCPSLAALPDGSQQLSALRSLNILSCTEIQYLPDGLKHATMLQSLEIRSCPRFMALPDWLDNLSSLRSLTISDCYSLTSLPIALKCLTALQHISIQDCPDLQRRCQQDRGEDWWKIAHVPHRNISSTQPNSVNCASSSSMTM